MKKQVTERIFKLTPIQASVIFRFPEFAEFTEFLFHLGKTQISVAFMNVFGYASRETENGINPTVETFVG